MRDASRNSRDKMSALSVLFQQALSTASTASNLPAADSQTQVLASHRLCIARLPDFVHRIDPPHTCPISSSRGPVSRVNPRPFQPK
jgi:hypothetical protein